VLNVSYSCIKIIYYFQHKFPRVERVCYGGIPSVRFSKCFSVFSWFTTSDISLMNDLWGWQVVFTRLLFFFNLVWNTNTLVM